MNRDKPSHTRRYRILAAGITVAVLLATASLLQSQETKSGPGAIAATNAPPAKAASAATNAPPAKAESAARAKKVRRKLSGAELYSMHCNRCHPERYPVERSPAQWRTIVLHMRVRANIPVEQARTILKFLQENSGV